MKKNSQKAVLAVAAMMVGSVFCTPVFAWDNTAIGYVGIDNGGYGNTVLSTDAQQTIGAIVSGSIGTDAVGQVGIFNGGYSNSIGVGTVGASAFGATNGTVNGNVGLFYRGTGYGDTQNSIEQGLGAKVAGGVGNTANGTVGSFTDSSGNKMLNVTVGTGASAVTSQSVGAFVGIGSDNTANGMVGQFTNAGNTYYMDGTVKTKTGGWNFESATTPASVPGTYPTTAINSNIVYASTGAAILAGSNNNATGTVGQFTGIIGANGGSYLNEVGASTGAQIDKGTSNTATGTVGAFNVGGDNTVKAGSMGAYIADGSSNTAIGTVGSFTSSNQATVLGTGAMIMGGSNNYANGQVGIFNHTFGNVTGIGAVIK